MSDTTLVWAYGGGKQSVYIAVLLAQGKLPKPDIIVMADTSREYQEVWDYKARHVDPLLASLGIKIEVATHDLATVDLYSSGGDLLIPAYTASGGKMQTFCSVEWKRRVMRRYLRSRGVEKCTTWIGMSRDEVWRLKPSDVKWETYQWPLVFDVPTTREGCRLGVINFGLPEPPKSACWMCPNRSDDEWLEMKQNAPKEFGKAVAFDNDMRQQDSALFLHRSCIPLDRVDFKKPRDLPLFDYCESGYCFV